MAGTYENIPRLGPWPAEAINSFSGGRRQGDRVQPAIWQPISGTYLPTVAPTANNAGAVAGDLAYDTAAGGYKAFDGAQWQPLALGSALSDQYQLVDNFQQLVQVPGTVGGGQLAPYCCQIQGSVAAIVQRVFGVVNRTCVVNYIAARVGVVQGGAATLTVSKASQGTNLSGGTLLHSGSIDLNTLNSNNLQVMTLAAAGTLALAVGDVIGCIASTAPTAAVAGIQVDVALPPVNNNFELAGTNAVNTCVGFYVGGGNTFTTTTGSGDQCIIQPRQNTLWSPWNAIQFNTAKAMTWQCEIVTDATIDNSTIWAGLKLTNTSVVATDNDQAFFRVARTTGATSYWTAVYSIANTDTTVTSTVALAASTRYLLRITVDTSRKARFYINGTLVATSTALTSLTTLKPYIGIQTGTTAARILNVRGTAISRAA